MQILTYQEIHNQKIITGLQPAPIDPLESEKQDEDVYLVPANSMLTTIEHLPETQNNQVLIITGNNIPASIDNIQIITSQMGQNYWTVENNQYIQKTIQTLDEQIPQDALIQPPTEQQQLALLPIEAQYEILKDKLIDALNIWQFNIVKSYDYRSITQAVLDDEAPAFKAWDTACLEKARELKAKVAAGELSVEILTPEYFIAQMPNLEDYLNE